MDTNKRELILKEEVYALVGCLPSVFGTRYVVDGPLIAPDDRSLNVRSAWYIHPDNDAPQFVTAHPLPKS